MVHQRQLVVVLLLTDDWKTRRERKMRSEMRKARSEKRIAGKTRKRKK